MCSWKPARTWGRYGPRGRGQRGLRAGDSAPALLPPAGVPRREPSRGAGGTTSRLGSLSGARQAMVAERLGV